MQDMEEEQDDMEMVVRPRDLPLTKMKMPFMYLPYRIFLECTNITDLVKECSKLDKDGTKKIQPNQSTRSIEIEHENIIRKIHSELHKMNWCLFGLHKLKFTCNTKQKLVEASIFRWNKIKSKRIYDTATDFQRQFLFLPQPIFEQVTNIHDVAILLHVDRFREEAITEDNLIAIIGQLHDQMHKLNRWQSGKMHDLRFLRPKPKPKRDVSEPLTRKPGRPRQYANKSPRRPEKNPSRDEQQPSTSRAYQHSPKNSTHFLNPRMHSTLLSPDKSIDSNSSMDDDDDSDQMSKRTRKRLHEASKSGQSSGELAVCPKKFKANELNRSDTSNHSNQNKSERENSNTSNKSLMSDTSGSITHPKKAPRRALKRSQQDPSDKATKVQRKVIEMDKNSFVEDTNINELIRCKYGKLTKKELQEKINHYYSLRSEWDDWKQHDCLKDLALKEDLSIFELSSSGHDVIDLVDSDDDADGVATKKLKNSPATKPGTSSELVSSAKNAKKVTSSSNSTVQKSSKRDKSALTEMQSEMYRKLSPLSVHELIEKTNIRQLIQKELEKCNATPDRFEQNMKKGVDKVFKVIQRPDKWQDWELMQHLKFVNVESDPSGSSKMNINNNVVVSLISSSCQEENDKSVQVEMSPIIDDMLSEANEKGNASESCGSSIPAMSKSHHPKTSEANAQVLLSTSSKALRPSEIEGNLFQPVLPTEVSQNQSSNTTQYSTQVQCGQESNPERVHEIPETRSQSIDIKGLEDAPAADVDESDVDMMDITSIPISNSIQETNKAQETNLIDQETQFEVSGNAENVFQIANQPSNNKTIDDNNGLSKKCIPDPDHISSTSQDDSTDFISDVTRVLSQSENETQEDRQSNPAHSQSKHTSSADAASQAEINVNFTETLPVPISTSTQISQVENPDTPQTHMPINDGSTMKIKPEPGIILPNSQALDSDVICEGTLNDPIIILRDTDDEFMEMKELMNGSAIINGDSDSFGISNESINQEVQACIMTVPELISTLSEEPSTTETVHAEIVYSTTEITTETTMSVKSGSTMRSSPLQCIENTYNAKSQILNQRPLSKRPIDKPSTKQMTPKRSKKTMDDTLSNILPPKYVYPPLQLMNKQSNGTVQETIGQKSTNVCSNGISIHTDDDVPICSSPQIDSDHGTPPTQASQCNIIEEFDSSGEINESNEKSLERSQMRSFRTKLLTQDNTWFININTQPITGNNEQPSTSKQTITAVPTVNIQMPPPVTVNSTEKSFAKITSVSTVPSHSRQHSTIQYLHYINIEKFESKWLIKAGEQSLNTNLQLKYQCNGRSKIVVTGESVRFILDLTENEWNAVNQVLSTIGDFTFNLNNLPSHKSVLHRVIYYLFKTITCFSNVHIEYNDQDFDTARAFYKPNVIDNVDVTQAFDPEFLESLKKFPNRMVQD